MKHSRFAQATAIVASFAMCLATAGPIFANGQNDFGDTATPIKHLVVIFQENVSFDHYFATYPNATNPTGEPQFHARPATPTVNGLSGALLTNNPNSFNTANGTGATNPFRLDRSEAATADQSHSYGPEQQAMDFGLVDLYPKSTGSAGPPPNVPAPNPALTTGLNMGYFDGNTVTAYWNYAQHFAMSDNAFGSTYGPSTPGVLNLVAGQTNGVDTTTATTGALSKYVDGTLYSDADPLGDVCSTSSAQVSMTSQTIGDLLNNAGVTWGGFMGGFDLKLTNTNGTTGCSRSTVSQYTGTQADYVPHHSFFQYFKNTQNLAHTRPASVAEIGNSGPANHQYDVDDFFAALKNGNLPAVSFLKAIAIQDGHPGNSDPLDEQTWVVSVVNALMQSRFWNDTAVVILYDDSDGWYDHQMAPVVNQSTSSADKLTGSGTCGNGTNTSLPGADATATPHAQGRCGYGIRQPLLVISPWARDNFVDHTIMDQSSVIRFIEDNWLGGQRLEGGSFDSIANSIATMFDFSRNSWEIGDRTLILNPTTGEPEPQFPF